MIEVQKQQMKQKVALVLIVIGLVLGQAGRAAAEKRRVGVPKFDGSGEAVVRKKLMKVLKDRGFELVKSRQIDAAARSTSARLDTYDGLAAVAQELAISAFVTGDVGKKKAKLTVHDGNDGSVIAEGAFAGANPRKIAAEVTRSFWRRLGAAVERGHVPASAKKPQKSAIPEAPEDNEEAPEAGGDEDEGENKAESKAESAGGKNAGSDEEAAPERPAKRRRAKPAAASTEEAPGSKPGAQEAAETGPSGPLPRALDVQLGFRGLSRHLDYHEQVGNALAPYSLTLGPALVADVVWYPGAHFGSGQLANFGVEAHIEQVFAVASQVMSTSGPKFPTESHEYAGGLRYRIPLGTSAELAVPVTAGEHVFVFHSGNGADRTNLLMPDIIYHYLRGGLEGRVGLPANLTAYAGAGYRYIANKGGPISSTSYFPHLSVAGLDAHVVVGYRIIPALEIRAGVDYRRYFYNMNSQAGDTFLVGGAVDQYLAFTAAAAFTLGGDGTVGAK
jgi:hypothetical protein